jgi:hypothetical protein
MTLYRGVLPTPLRSRTLDRCPPHCWKTYTRDSPEAQASVALATSASWLIASSVEGEIEIEGNADKVVLAVGTFSRVVLMFVVGIELNVFADGK